MHLRKFTQDYGLNQENYITLGMPFKRASCLKQKRDDWVTEFKNRYSTGLEEEVEGDSYHNEN